MEIGTKSSSFKALRALCPRLAEFARIFERARVHLLTRKTAFVLP